jgi:hypothetical protein
MTLDLATVPTEPYTADAPHRRLAELAGAWHGVMKTTFEPGKPPIEERVEGALSLVLGGRFARFTYRSALQGKVIAGELTLAWEAGDKRWATAWIDSFHTGTTILLSTGEPAVEDLDVRGTYFAAEGEPRWGWRTRLQTSTASRLVVRMDNVMPDGSEDEAVVFELARP